MSPLEEDPLHPIAPVLRVRPARPIQVPPRVLRALKVPGGWNGPDRRRRNRRQAAPAREEPPPETYDDQGHILPPRPRGGEEQPRVDLEV
jgi:hypothetical protein